MAGAQLERSGSEKSARVGGNGTPGWDQARDHTCYKKDEENADHYHAVPCGYAKAPLGE